jgi:hypothetical protein
MVPVGLVSAFFYTFIGQGFPVDAERAALHPENGIAMDG